MPSLRRSSTFAFLQAIALLWLGVASLGVQAQLPYLEPYHFQHRKQELNTKAILQDQQGYLWFGTTEGLFRFDGVSHQQYTTADSLATNRVTALAEDTSGTLWIGHQDGQLSCWKAGKITHFIAEFEPEAAISDLHFDREGHLWIGTEGDGVYVLKEGATKRLGEAEGMPDSFVYDLEEAANGLILAGTDGGLAIVTWATEEPTIEVLNYDKGLPDNIVRKILCTEEGTVFLGTEDEGVVKVNLEDQSIQHPLISGNWRQGAVNGLVQQDGKLWIASSRKGVLVFDLVQNKTEYLTRSKGWTYPRANTLQADQEGNIWFGTAAGIFRTSGDHLMYITEFEGAYDHNVLALAIDLQQQIWYATEEGLFKRSISPKGDVLIEKPLEGNPLSENTFISLHVDELGFVWAGTYGNGVVRINPEDGKVEALQDEFGNGNILSMTPGESGVVWLATLGGASKAQIESNGSLSIHNLGKMDGLVSSYIYQVFEDSQGRVWFGTDGDGVVCQETSGEFKAYGPKDGFESKVAYSFAEDQQGTLWVNCREEGIYRKAAGEDFVAFTSENGPRDLSVGAMAVDQRGRTVLIHDYGIDVFDPQEERFFNLGEEVGIIDQFPNLNAVTTDLQGQIWFGTEAGIVTYSDLLHQLSDGPVPHIREVLLYQEAVDDVAVLQDLSYDQNNLTFQYNGFWYLDPGGVNYRYKLENYDASWMETKNHTVTYSSLPPGSYNFRLQVAGSTDFKHPRETSITVVVSPPFWQQIWFYALVLVVAVAGVYLFIRLRERNLLEAKQILEEKVVERTKEIAAQNERLARQHEQITESITYAQRIQNAILPLEKNLERAFPKHFIFYQPRDIVSGDFYWFYRKGDVSYLAAADCTGHGVPGAMMSMIGYALLNEIVSGNPGITPAGILNKLNESIVESLKQDHTAAGTSKDGMDIALCSYNAKQNTFVYSGAKRPMYLIQNDELEVVKGDRFSIGGDALGADESFTDVELQPDAGTKVYFFSDGYPDQFGGPKNRKFMLKRFRQVVAENHSRSAQEQHELFANLFRDWKGEVQQTDDILVIGLFF